MARIDLPPEDRDRQRLQLASVLDCPECETMVEHVFTADAGVYDSEDLLEAPTEMVSCPACGHNWLAEYSGWVAHGDAG